MLKALQCILVLQSVSLSVCQSVHVSVWHAAFHGWRLPSLYAFSALPPASHGKNRPLTHTHTHTHTGAVCLGIWRSGVVNEQEVVSLPWTKWGFFFSNCRHYWGKDWGIFFKTQNLLKEAPMWEPTLSSLGQTWVLQDRAICSFSGSVQSVLNVATAPPPQYSALHFLSLTSTASKPLTFTPHNNYFWGLPQSTPLKIKNTSLSFLNFSLSLNISLSG